MQLSIVIPLLNEEESLNELYNWIASVMRSNSFSYEVIFIDDGSTDNSWKIIKKISAEDPFVKGIKFNRNYGKSQALHVGFEKAEGDVVITMDADLQDNPEEIPELIRPYRKRKLRPHFGLEKEALRLGFIQKPAIQAVQCCSKKNFGLKASRFQLRT